MNFLKITSIGEHCNRNKNKNQILFLYNSFTKNNWITELTNDDSDIYTFIKEEVEELFYNAGGYLKYLDFESCYKLAVEVTINQVEKNIFKNKKCFFEIERNDNLLVYKKIKQRLVNNLKNLFDQKRRINVLNINLSLMDEIYKNYKIDTRIWDLQKLAISNPQIIIDNIKKLANNFELSFIEIEELSEKLNMNFSEKVA